MEALVINGPSRLRGEVLISGSKNSCLPLLFTSILFSEELVFTNVPRLWDVETTLQLLQSMGATTRWDKDSATVSIRGTIKEKVAPYEWVKKMRAGILALGPLVARFGEAKVSLPGGCAIGARPVDYHIDAMKKMGVSFKVEQGYIHAQCLQALQGAEIEFPKVTVTGTENLLVVACYAKGTTQLKNAAREPEVIALGEFLIDCGAKIEGLGTDTITIHESSLRPPKNATVIPADRIETGTWISISTMTQSPLTLKGVDFLSIGSILKVYESLGVRFEKSEKEKLLKVTPPEELLPIELETQPYPGFPTDMQAQLVTNLCKARGVSRVRETIFENRFMHVAELNRLGANIRISGNEAIIPGGVSLIGAPLMATDLRASASLVIAGLAAKGTTKISRIYHLDRGYQKLDTRLNQLGAEISRIKENV